MFDVIVVGAGPAGSSAARECAQKGMDVVMLDKAEFPRDKPCGGGVNLRAAALLPFDVAPVTERIVYGMRISVGQRREYTRYSDHPLTYLTQRRLLDTYLAEHAERAGARFDQRTPIRAVERDRHGVTVQAGKQEYRGRVLVVADGANGPTARLAGIDVSRSKEIALEGNISPVGGLPAHWRDVYGIELGSVPGGYGWLFPKGDHLNIGVGGIAHVGPTLRARLTALTAFYGFKMEDFWGLRGHPLPVRTPGAVCAADNVAVIGDAAGFLDPLSGEGIYGAVWSGKLVATHIRAFLDSEVGDLLGFQRDIETQLEPDLRASRELHALFHLGPPAWAQLVEHSDRAWRLLCALVTGDTTYVDVKRRSPVLRVGIERGAQMAMQLRGRPVADMLPSS